MITTLMSDIKHPQPKKDFQPCQVEKCIQILNKAESSNHCHSRSSACKFKGKMERNGEDKWREGVTKRHSASSLCQMKENYLLSKPSTHQLNLGLAAKKMGVLPFHPVSVSFQHSAFLLQCLQGLSCLFCLAFTPI